MTFKFFFTKKILPSFFVSVACISVLMAVLGMIFFPKKQFGFEAFWYPLFFGLAAVLPQLVTFAKKELTVKKMFLRNILHLILLEAVILLFNYWNGALYNMAVTLSLAFSVFLIDVTVQLVLWMNEKKTAKEFNENLKQWQENRKSERT